MDTKRTRWWSVPVMVGALLATTLPAEAAPRERPIREDLSGYLTGMELAPEFPAGDTFGDRCSQPSQWVSTSSGTGQVAHLGRVSWTVEHCFQMLLGTYTDGHLTMTAANGDMLFGTYHGAMTGETTLADTVTITGGTGRFVGATGQIEETGWVDMDTGYMELTGNGTIVYDASNRASTD